MALHASVLSGVALTGISIELIDYAWSVGTEMVNVESVHVLRRRISTGRVYMHAILDGEEQAFGELMFFPAAMGIPLSRAERGESVRMIQVNVNQDLTLDVDDEMAGHLTSAALRPCLDLRLPQVDQAIRWMGQELAAPGFSSRQVIESLSSIVLIGLARHFTSESRDLRLRTYAGRLSSADVGRVTDMIAAARTPPSLGSIAAECGISSSHLRRAFRNTTGQPIQRYIDDLQLEKAKVLLTETDFPLKEISFQLGFSAPASFSSAFRRLQGETPSRFRSRSLGSRGRPYRLEHRN